MGANVEELVGTTADRLPFFFQRMVSDEVAWRRTCVCAYATTFDDVAGANRYVQEL